MSKTAKIPKQSPQPILFYFPALSENSNISKKQCQPRLFYYRFYLPHIVRHAFHPKRPERNCGFFDILQRKNGDFQLAFFFLQNGIFKRFGINRLPERSFVINRKRQFPVWKIRPGAAPQKILFFYLTIFLP